MAPNAPLPVLHQFRTSHFNEKARWALDWKGLEHRRVSHLPGPHALSIGRMTGQTATPVLVLEGRTIAGSAAILEALEKTHPSPPLTPEDPEARRQCLELQTEWDERIGPAVRTVVFNELVREPDAMVAIFAGHHGPTGRALYRAAFPIVGTIIERAHDVHRPELVDAARELVDETLDSIARRVSKTGHVVGRDFGLADLVCAALLAPLVRLDHPDMRREPMPERMIEALAKYEEREAIAWVREQYARNRPAPCAVD